MIQRAAYRVIKNYTLISSRDEGGWRAFNDALNGAKSRQILTREKIRRIVDEQAKRQ